MKKLPVLFTLLALFLSACSAQAAPAMYIQPVQLTEEEEAVAKLLGADMDQYLFDVVLDGTAKTVCVQVYELVDGAWELSSGGGGMSLGENAAKGRMAFGFEDLRGGSRNAIQFGGDLTAVTRHPPEGEEEDSGLSRATAFLSSRTEIVYEREIPLAVQISTAKDSILSYDPEYFFRPEEYEKHGYEHVCALTVTFSQEPLS